MKEPFVLIELFPYIHVFINIFIHLHTHFTHLKKSPPFSKSPVNIFIFNPGTSSSYLGNWWDESERSMWDIHPMIPDMMILWWQQIYRWTLSEGSINHIFSPVHQSISHQWIIDESIWLHSGFDAVSCRCGHVFEEKKEGIQHVHTYPWCQTTPSNTPFVWSQGPNPPLSQVPSQTFPWFLHVSSLHVQGCKVDKTKNQESSFASPNSTFDQNMSSPLFKVNCWKFSVFSRWFSSRELPIASLPSFFWPFCQNGFWLLKSAVGATSTLNNRSSYTVRSNHFRVENGKYIKNSQKVFPFSFEVLLPQEESEVKSNFHRFAEETLLST